MAGQFGQDIPPPLPGNSRLSRTTASVKSPQPQRRKVGWLRRWFWTPVKQQENWAQTVFRVLGNLSRTTLTLLVLLVVTALAATFISDQSFRRAEAEREATKPQNFVSVSIDFTFLEDENKDFADGCNKSFPFATEIHNGSKMAMTETWLVFSVRKKGTTEALRFRGTDFSGGFSDRWQDAKGTYTDVIRNIILPNSSLGWCWNFPPDAFFNFDPAADYAYEVEIGSSTVFAEPEDWMYQELGQAK